MDSDVVLPEDTAKQWEVLLCIIAFEEKKIDRRNDGALETLTYFWNHRGVKHIFAEWMQQMRLRYDKQISDEESSKKNDAISLLWRQRGNTKFRAGQYEESFKLYTKSVIYADKLGPLYSMALANRSAASWRMGNYKETIKDIQRALSYNYPIDLQHKLYLRRADCFLELGQKQKAIDAIASLNRHNTKIPLKGQSKVEFDKAYKALLEKLESVKDDVPEDELNLPQLFLGENPDFRNASAAIELKRSDTAGRYVVTKEATKRGDVLFSEEPYASVVIQEENLPPAYYCDYCCSNDTTVVSCSECTATVYCDEGCHYLSSVIYHRWECAAIRSRLFSVVGIAHLAFRVVLKYAHRGFPALPEGTPKPTTAAELIDAYTNVDKVGIYKDDPTGFYTMFNLTSNLDSSANTDNIQYALTATMLTLYLEHYTSFFDYFPERLGENTLPLSECKLLCAALIFRTLGQLVINAHTVLDLNTAPPLPNKPPPAKIDPWRRVGSAIYPTISMMNHSCEPNIINVFYKNHLYVKGLRELPEGAEVLNCYGPHYARESLAERRDKLRTQYGFLCECLACSDESRKDFTTLFTAYACPSCKGPVTWEGKRMGCHQCSNEFPLQKAQNAAETAEAMHATVNCKRCHLDIVMEELFVPYDKGHALMHTALRARTAEERCERMVRSYRLMQQVLYRHHNILRKTADDLAKLYAAIGEYSKSIDLIKHNIQSFEYQFGSFSVEVTNEIRKMANMMLGRIIKYFDNPELDERQPMNIRDWIRETLKIVKKANQLMELNYGTWPPMYKALKEKEDLLEGMVNAPRFHDNPDCLNMKLQALNII